MRPVLAAALLGTAALLSAQDAAPAAPAPVAPAPAAPAPAAAKPLEAREVADGFLQFGHAVGGQSPLPGFRANYEMTPAEVDAFLAGLRLAMLGQPAPVSDAALASRFQEFLQARVAARSDRARQANAAFLAKVDADKAVTKTASGLRYQVVKAGDAAAKPKATSTVTCRYHGTLADGTVFDSTRNRNDEPVTFGLAEVIPGWTEGLQLVGKGGVIKLWIPAELAYADVETGPIPAGSTLAFEIEVVDVK